MDMYTQAPLVYFKFQNYIIIQHNNYEHHQNSVKSSILQYYKYFSNSPKKIIAIKDPQ